MNWLVKENVCPGLFYGTPAQDGFLVRIRTPGGILEAQQGREIATLLDQWATTIQVTNRANLQIRGVQESPTLANFQTLQKLGLAASNPSIDHLRNIMGSPTAGIDSQELVDTRELIKELDNFIQNHPEIAALSPKFSIGIDGGGAVGIGTRSSVAWEHRYNEIQLSAIAVNNQQNQPNATSNLAFRLALGGDKQLEQTDILIAPENCLSVVAALVIVYLDYVQQNPSINGKKNRMKHLLKDWGVEKYLEQVNSQLNHPLEQTFSSRSWSPLEPTAQPYSYLGIHDQKQAELAYVGLPLRLGKLTADQLRGLGELSETFGSSQFRLTPWQTVILPDIPKEKVPDLLLKLASLGLSAGVGWDAVIVACAGKPGCGRSATATQIHGAILADYLQQVLPEYLGDRSTGNIPVNIHLTGCDKSCAQPSPAEITLLGTTIEQNGELIEGYKVYLGDGKQSLKSQIFTGEFAKIPSLIAKILTTLKVDSQQDE